MENIDKIRHSLSHLLAMAVLEKYPGTKLGIGPAIETGFYYDFQLPENVSITSTDLAALENRMRELITQDIKFVRGELSVAEAKNKFSDQPYKLELIEELANAGEQISIYESGKFVDLCAGPHINSTEEIPIDCFKLEKVAGAYWRGDEKNKMLARIYGLAFNSKKELEEYLAVLEEAKKRDHRKLGVELDLFTFSPLVGSGLPLWTPRGTIIRDQLNDYVWELRSAKGYERVTIPHITKKDLYETSGHWMKFADELFKIQTREGKTYCLKPMNCPHHTQIYNHLPRSYRDMPQRYAETTMVYRDEQSGELGGLTRVLSITQDDAHVFCRYNQIKQEFFAIWEIIDTFYKTFDFKLRVRLSFHDPEHMEKYLGTPEIWQKAESEIKDIAEEMKADYFIGIGEAAMYGPKLDFMAKDSIGREHQVATIQLDMNMPERFDLTCINEKGEKERIVMIHCAIMGSIERFSAVLIEHLAGNFPTWLAPIQVIILPIGEAHQEYANKVRSALEAKQIRIQILTGDTLGKRIREAKLQKVPYILVLGDKEVKDNCVTVERRGSDEKGVSVPLTDFIAKISDEINNRTN
jgi:threonyl-tRNA synthetase